MLLATVTPRLAFLTRLRPRVLATYLTCVLCVVFMLLVPEILDYELCTIPALSRTKGGHNGDNDKGVVGCLKL
jgi:hypothetical protein